MSKTGPRLQGDGKLIPLVFNYKDVSLGMFPHTMSILTPLPQGLLINAAFSCLEPNACTERHRDYDKRFYRCHLPILIPPHSSSLYLDAGKKRLDANNTDGACSIIQLHTTQSTIHRMKGLSFYWIASEGQNERIRLIFQSLLNLSFIRIKSCFGFVSFCKSMSSSFNLMQLSAD